MVSILSFLLSKQDSSFQCLIDPLFIIHQGYAYTFITEDQARYAGDIIKALELSGTAVPPDLEKLWSDFKDQQKAVSFLNTI